MSGQVDNGSPETGAQDESNDDEEGSQAASSGMDNDQVPAQDEEDQEP